MNDFRIQFLVLCLFAVLWFFGYEALRRRRARRFKGQSSQTFLMEIVYLGGWLLFIFAILISVVIDVLQRHR